MNSTDIVTAGANYSRHEVHRYRFKYHGSLGKQSKKVVSLRKQSKKWCRYGSLGKQRKKVVLLRKQSRKWCGYGSLGKQRKKVVLLGKLREATEATEAREATEATEKKWVLPKHNENFSIFC